MNEYKIIILRERPELAPIAAEWFHCKWGVPTEAYLECMLSLRMPRLRLKELQMSNPFTV